MAPSLEKEKKNIRNRTSRLAFSRRGSAQRPAGFSSDKLQLLGIGIFYASVPVVCVPDLIFGYEMFGCSLIGSCVYFFLIG